MQGWYMGDLSWTSDTREERDVFPSQKGEPQDGGCREEKDRQYPPNSCHAALTRQITNG